MQEGNNKLTQICKTKKKRYEENPNDTLNSEQLKQSDTFQSIFQSQYGLNPPGRPPSIQEAGKISHEQTIIICHITPKKVRLPHTRLGNNPSPDHRPPQQTLTHSISLDRSHTNVEYIRPVPKEKTITITKE